MDLIRQWQPLQAKDIPEERGRGAGLSLQERPY